MNNNTAQDPQDQSYQGTNSYVDDYQPPGDVPTVSATQSSPPKPVIQDAPVTPNSPSEVLEDQNIFAMLGVHDGSEEEKESFLDELQQVVWDDFLENDVELLITTDEKKEFNSLMKGKDGQTDTQDVVVSYLETLIPDLEEIMLEKALKLKSDLFAERIVGMREYHADKPKALATINSAEKMMQEDKWHAASELLNKIDS